MGLASFLQQHCPAPINVINVQSILPQCDVKLAGNNLSHHKLRDIVNAESVAKKMVMALRNWLHLQKFHTKYLQFMRLPESIQ